MEIISTMGIYMVNTKNIVECERGKKKRFKRKSFTNEYARTQKYLRKRKS